MFYFKLESMKTPYSNVHFTDIRAELQIKAVPVFHSLIEFLKGDLLIMHMS
jgi:hypothetical protein